MEKKKLQINIWINAPTFHQAFAKKKKSKSVFFLSLEASLTVGSKKRKKTKQRPGIVAPRPTILSTAPSSICMFVSVDGCDRRTRGADTLRLSTVERGAHRGKTSRSPGSSGLQRNISLSDPWGGKKAPNCFKIFSWSQNGAHFLFPLHHFFCPFAWLHSRVDRLENPAEFKVVLKLKKLQNFKQVRSSVHFPENDLKEAPTV